MTHLDITPTGSRPTARGPAQTFTGNVTIDPLFDASEHTHWAGSLVSFEPGARTARHAPGAETGQSRD